jgi:quercetin dioxygenase-like cupin family protein
MSTESFRTKVLLRSEQTDDQVSVIETTVPTGFPGPPLHHHDFDETFYVLEGELTVQLEEEIFTRTRGELAFALRNVPHTFANLSGASARTLIICTPAGFERFFDRMAAERAGVEPPASALEPYPETIVVGPRIGEQDPEAHRSNRKERSS